MAHLSGSRVGAMVGTAAGTTVWAPSVLMAAGDMAGDHAGEYNSPRASAAASLLAFSCCADLTVRGTIITIARRTAAAAHVHLLQANPLSLAAAEEPHHEGRRSIGSPSQCLA